MSHPFMFHHVSLRTTSVSTEGNEVQPTEPNQEATPAESIATVGDLRQFNQVVATALQNVAEQVVAEQVGNARQVFDVSQVAADPEMRAFLRYYGMDIDTMESSRYWEKLPLNRPEEIDASTDSVYTQSVQEIIDPIDNTVSTAVTAALQSVEERLKQLPLNKQEETD